MFSNIKTIIANHAAQINTIKKAYCLDKEKFFDSDVYSKSFKDSKLTEITNTYNEKKMSFILKSGEQIESAFSEMFNDVEQVVSADISQDMVAELNLISEMTLSDFEFSAYSHKYAGNYMAMRKLNDIAIKNDKLYSFVSSDDIISELNFLKSCCVNFLNTYDGNLPDDYFTRYVFLSATGKVEDNLITRIEKDFNNFLNPQIVKDHQ